MDILTKIKQGFVIFDGGTGTILQEQGLKPGELPETWNVLYPEKIVDLHKSYVEAGANILKTNTFGANSLKFNRKDGGFTLTEIIEAAVKNSKTALEQCGANDDEHYIALDIGPLGKMLEPLGDMPFETAVGYFSEIVKIGVKCGVDLVLIETMNDAYEAKAAVLAAKESCDLPVFCTTVYDENAKLMTGADTLAMVALLEGLGVDALGINCSLGPQQMIDIVGALAQYASVPLIVNPNAGLPRFENGVTFYDVTPSDFGVAMAEIARRGGRILGGCCGTTPKHIAALIHSIKNMEPVPLEEKNLTVVSSYTHGVTFGGRPILIGERINPTGKSKFKQALRDHNLDYILGEGIAQQEKGVDILDVNVGLPEIDEPAMMKDVIFELQSVLDLPLQIDTSDPVAMECGMRLYNGKPLVNSVNGKEESMAAIFPLVAKYGGVVIGLTLDENGIPETAQGRLAIAEKIIKRGADFGIKPKNIIFDPLAMTISSDPQGALTTLEAIRLIRSKLKAETSLGVSNISFGLPNRDFITSTFFAMALENGLKAAIMNPYSLDMMKTFYSFCALSAQDENCGGYIDFASNITIPAPGGGVQGNLRKDKGAEEGNSPLRRAIVKGLKEQAAHFAAEMMKETAALDLIDGEIIPALDFVGKGFEDKTVFLPQLLMSAEAAKAAFDVVKSSFSDTERSSDKKVILATVKGDIHDIGKNIVKVLLENYGFNVIDLGKDVEPELIRDTVLAENVGVVGLSALMTTTVPAMADTIELLRKESPNCRVMVGGAVLTQDYADMIGADFYSKDAIGAVRYVESYFNL